MCVCVCVYLKVSGSRDGGDTVHPLGVAAARAPLHLHTRRPQHEVGIAGVVHGPGHFLHLCTHLALRYDRLGGVIWGEGGLL